MGRLIAASSVERRPEEWIWPNYIPRRFITLLQGITATNKTTMMMDLSARLSIGREMPGCSESAKPSGVLLFANEDLPSDIRKNLEANEADASRVLIFEDDGAPFSLPRSEQFLESEILRHKASMAVFDPISDYVEGSPNAERSVRHALAALNRVARRTGAAMVLLRHLNKDESASAINRGAGSFAYVSMARSCLHVATSPVDKDQRIFALLKSNRVKSADSIAFRPFGDGGGLRVEWLGASPYSTADLLGNSKVDENSALMEACYVLYSISG